MTIRLCESTYKPDYDPAGKEAIRKTVAKRAQLARGSLQVYSNFMVMTPEEDSNIAGPMVTLMLLAFLEYISSVRELKGSISMTH